MRIDAESELGAKLAAALRREEASRRNVTSLLAQLRESQERVVELEGRLDEWDNLLKHALEGREAEFHCACCAALRARVHQLESAQK
jgi:nucleoside-diphosphate-sugar epimerase